MSYSVEDALRYLFQVGYNVGHSDVVSEKPYNGDAGKQYHIFETREPEAGILRSLVEKTGQPDEAALASTMASSLMHFDGMVEERARVIVETFLTIVRPCFQKPKREVVGLPAIQPIYHKQGCALMQGEHRDACSCNEVEDGDAK